MANQERALTNYELLKTEACLSSEKIAKYFNDLGFEPYSARKFTPQIIRSILHRGVANESFQERCGLVLKHHAKKMKELASSDSVTVI